MKQPGDFCAWLCDTTRWALRRLLQPLRSRPILDVRRESHCAEGMRIVSHTASSTFHETLASAAIAAEVQRRVEWIGEGRFAPSLVAAAAQGALIHVRLESADVLPRVVLLIYVPPFGQS